jgi:hypothetical protein
MSVFTFSTDASTKGFAGKRVVALSKVTAAARRSFLAATASTFLTSFSAVGGVFSAFGITRAFAQSQSASTAVNSASQVFGNRGVGIEVALGFEPLFTPTLVGAFHAPGFIRTYASWCTIAVNVNASE